ncbi:MAG: glutamate--tRNA ligase [Candidatus Blackburnbacteria bacterium]|nr:glutamate--tRNA ligase [Candidatus Blackburnbacteria bacterium]
MVESIVMAKQVRVRIAPSPTGFAHIGTGYMALFNYAFAKKNNGTFIVRLEDSDLKRHVTGAEEAIYAGLNWLGLKWDEGPDIGGPHAPYRVSEKLDRYKKIAEQLISEGKAYHDEGAVRFKNTGEDMGWTDLVRGDIVFPGSEVTDFVILKSDGYPTYNFYVVVDDAQMEITHIIRGEEHISNTPRQLALYEALGYKVPQFAHLPTLRNAEHKKLSKRRDPVDLRLYREQGYLPEALINFLCLLGWSHPEGKEVFGLEEFIEKFTLERVRKAGPIFDTKKLDWLNGLYIRQMDNVALASTLNKYISADTSTQFLLQVVPLIKERINKLSDAENLLKFFWEKPQIGREMFENEKSLEFITSALEALRGTEDWTLEAVNEALMSVVNDKSYKTGDFFMCLRLSVTGQKITPPLNESMIILGKEEVLVRLETAQKVLLM